MPNLHCIGVLTVTFSSRLYSVTNAPLGPACELDGGGDASEDVCGDEGPISGEASSLDSASISLSPCSYIKSLFAKLGWLKLVSIAPWRQVTPPHRTPVDLKFKFLVLHETSKQPK